MKKYIPRTSKKYKKMSIRNRWHVVYITPADREAMLKSVNYNHDELYDLISEASDGPYSHVKFWYFLFAKKSDAVMFKLKWCNSIL